MMDLVAAPRLDQHRLLRELGPEPLSNAFNGPELAARLAGRRSPIKAALLDQKVVAGIGNIYACEALFFAGLSPRRQAYTVQGGRAERLARAIREVLDRASKRVVVITQRVVVEHPYECSSAVQALLAARGLPAVAADYGESVRFEVAVPESELQSFLGELRDRTAGRASARPEEAKDAMSDKTPRTAMASLAFSPTLRPWPLPASRADHP